VADGKLVGLDLRSAERELAEAARRHGPALAAGRRTLAAFQEGLRRFYRDGGHTRRC
jgi:hypothetical protein